MTHCQIKNACGLATLRPGFSCHYALLKPGPWDAVRRQDSWLARKKTTFYLVTAQRFILGLTDITTMPSIRSINLPEQTLALAQQLQLLLVAVLLQSV